MARSRHTRDKFKAGWNIFAKQLVAGTLPEVRGRLRKLAKALADIRDVCEPVIEGRRIAQPVCDRLDALNEALGGTAHNEPDAVERVYELAVKALQAESRSTSNEEESA